MIDTSLLKQIHRKKIHIAFHIGKDCKELFASCEINARTKRLGVTFLVINVANQKQTKL